MGFPNETEELFQETVDFVKKIKFSKIHVFPFSVRRGTKAELMDNQVSEEIKKDRVKRLVNLSNELEQKYLEKFIGDIVEVLIETNKEGYSYGHTTNYLKVKINEILPSNSLVNVKIIKRNNLELEGVVYESK